MQKPAIILEALGKNLKEKSYERGFRHGDAYISEFPKSGGTWVMNLTHDLLSSSGSVKDPSVLHQHWSYHPRYRPALYVLRDGRDVVVSLYFHHLRELQSPARWRASRIDRYLAFVLGKGYDVADVRGNLPTFIESLAERPLGGILPRRRESAFRPWPEHLEDWMSRPGVHVVRYEDLLEQPVEELRQIREHLKLSVADPALTQIVERNSFRAVSGRAPGAEDPRSFLRKGVAGDWRTWFTRDAGEAFDKFGGEALICCGYESDRRWIDGLPNR